MSNPTNHVETLLRRGKITQAQADEMTRKREAVKPEFPKLRGEALPLLTGWMDTETSEERANVAKRRKIRDLSGTPEERTHETRRKAKRNVYHLRKDGFVDFAERETVALKIIRHTMRRIVSRNNLSLSPTDKADGEAAGMVALVSCGFFSHGRISLSTFRALRNAIQGRDCLRVRCKWEYASDDIAGIAATVGFVTESETVEKRLTRFQRDMAKEIMRALRASFSCDASRKAIASFRSQRDFFLIVLGHLTGSSSRAMSAGTFDTRKSRFVDYLAKGADQLRATRKPVNLGAEIMQALSDRAFKQTLA